MQHNVTDTVLTAFSRARAGLRWQSPLGFSVVALHSGPIEGFEPAAFGLTASEPWLVAAAAKLIWREAKPPHPNYLQALNRSAAPIVVNAGDVLDGGMSMRVGRTTTFISARGELRGGVDG